LSVSAFALLARVRRPRPPPRLPGSERRHGGKLDATPVPGRAPSKPVFHHRFAAARIAERRRASPNCHVIPNPWSPNPLHRT